MQIIVKIDEEKNEKLTKNIINYLRCHACPFVAVFGVELKNEPLFLGCKGTFLQTRVEMVGPSEPATLATAVEPGIPPQRIPVPFAVFPHAIYQNLILRRGPGTFLQGQIVTLH